ncbi:MAG: caspase family protein [Schleiferiaceae bacterium]|nr:caspase family protein [Schleiferiaceae bacterium]
MFFLFASRTIRLSLVVLSAAALLTPALGQATLHTNENRRGISSSNEFLRLDPVLYRNPKIIEAPQPDWIGILAEGKFLAIRPSVGDTVVHLAAEGQVIRTVSWGPSGQFIYYATESGQIKQKNTLTGEEFVLHSGKKQNAQAAELSISPDEQNLLAVFEDGTLGSLNLKFGGALEWFDTKKKKREQVTWSPDSRYFMLKTDKNLEVWDLETKTSQTSEPLALKNILDIEWSRSGNEVFLLNDCGQLLRINASSLETVGTLSLWQGSCNSIQSGGLFGQGSRVVLASKDSLHVYAAENGAAVNYHPFGQIYLGKKKALSFSTRTFDNNVFATTSTGECLRIRWDKDAVMDFNWQSIAAQPGYRLEDFVYAPGLDDLLAGPDDWDQIVHYNAFLNSRFKEKSQFETQGEFEKRLIQCIPSLLDELHRLQFQNVRMEEFYSQMAWEELIQSRRPERLVYGVDYNLGTYRLEDRTYPVKTKLFGDFSFQLDRQEAQAIFQNAKNWAIEGISQIDPSTNNERTLVNAVLREINGNRSYELTAPIDLLAVKNYPNLPPVLDAYLDDPDQNADSLKIRLVNTGAGSAQDLVICLAEGIREFQRYVGTLEPKSEKIVYLPLASYLEATKRTATDVRILIKEKGTSFSIESWEKSIAQSQATTEDQKAQIQSDPNLIRIQKNPVDGDVLGVTWSPDSKMAAVLSVGQITVFDNLSKNKIRTFATEGSKPVAAIFSNSSDFLIAALNNQVVLVFDLKTSQVFQRFTVEKPILGIYNSGNNDEILLLLSQLEGVTYNYRTGRMVRQNAVTIKESVQQPELDPRLSTLIGLSDKSLKAFDFNSGVLKWTTRLNNPCVHEYKIDPTGQYVLILGCDSTASVFDLSNGKKVRSLEHNRSQQIDAHWATNRGYLVSLTAQQQALFWDDADFIPVESYGVSLRELDHLTVSPDGNHVLFYSDSTLAFYKTGRRAVLENDLTLQGAMALGSLQMDDVGASALRAFEANKNQDQFETAEEFQLRRRAEVRNLAKVAYNQEMQNAVNQNLEQNRRAAAIANSRKRIRIPSSAVELGKYDLRSGEYSIRISDVWERIPMSKEDARHFFIAGSQLRAEAIQQLSDNRDREDSAWVNTVLYHPTQGTAIPFGEHIALAGGTLSTDLPPQIEVLEVQFQDNDEDQVLSAGENAQIRFTLTNKGQGTSRMIVLAGESDFTTTGLLAFLDDLKPGETKDVFVPLAGPKELTDGETTLRFKISDGAGFGAAPVALKLETKSYRLPDVQFRDVAVADVEGRSVIVPGSVVSITIRLSNQGEGTAQQVNAKINAGNGVVILNAIDNSLLVPLGALSPGSYKDFSFQAYCNNDLTSAFPLTLSMKTEGQETFGLPQDLGLVVNAQQKGLTELFFKKESAAASSSGLDDLKFTAAPGRPVRENSVALVIGNKNYKWGIPAVEYALNDAFSVKEFLIQHHGYKPGNVLVLENATLSDLKVVLGDGVVKGRLHDIVKPGTTELFVYYSGHGAPGINNGDSFLLPVDANPDKLELTAIRLSQFIETIASLNPVKTTFAVDACFSGATNGGENIIKGASSLAIKLKPVAQQRPNQVILTASGDNEVASWYDDKRHGLFTYYLLKGLSGSADTDKNQAVTTAEMRRYLLDQQNGIPYKARELFSRDQNPQINGNENFVF